MGSIVKRKNRDGSFSFRAQIILKAKGKIVHQESSSFNRESTAAAWMEKREKELRSPGGLEVAQRKGKTVKRAIELYLAEQRGTIGKTKAQVLTKIVNEFLIADVECAELTSSSVVDFARDLANGGRSPATVGNYLSHLSGVLAVARSAWGFQIDRDALSDGLEASRRLNYSGKSKERDRRPTLDELDLIIGHFLDSYQRDRRCLPMHRIVTYAVFSARRLDEITRVTWEDFDAVTMRQMVRAMKDPKNKATNDVPTMVQDDVLRAMKLQPHRTGRIFPANGDTVSARFTRACALLGIENLHFHDLRHEAVSRLFEMGSTIPEVAAVSGHKSWQSLKRYTHLRAKGDKYANWKWWDILEEDAKGDPHRERLLEE